MSSNKPDQFLTAAQSSLQTHLTVWSQLASKSFENATKLADLNVRVLQSALQESTAGNQHLLAVKDPKDFWLAAASQSQPQIEKMLSYGRELSDIWATLQADLARAVQAEADERRQSLAKLPDNAAGAIPDGMTAMVNLMKSTFENAGTSYGQFLKTANESTKAIQSSLLPHTGKTAQKTRKDAGRSEAG